MALPKAVVCALGDYAPNVEEASLRKVGFATAVIHWRELCANPNDWMQLSDILEEKAISALVVAGEPEALVPEIQSKIALLQLSLQRQRLPELAFVFCEVNNWPQLPTFFAGASKWHSLDAYAGMLMAKRFKPAERLPLPFHCKSHLDPLLGLWLELGTPGESKQEGFMAGIVYGQGSEGGMGQPDAASAPTGAEPLLQEQGQEVKNTPEIGAFGVDVRGVLPSKSTLAYPMLGIRGYMAGLPFIACAAKNVLTPSTACFCKIEGIPHGVFLTNYPEDGAEELVGSSLIWAE